MKGIRSNFEYIVHSKGKQIVAFLLCCLLFNVGSFISVKADASKMNATEWNGKQGCNVGSWAVIASVNAPSIRITIEPGNVVADHDNFIYIHGGKKSDATERGIEKSNTTLVPAQGIGMIIKDKSDNGLLKLLGNLRFHSTGRNNSLATHEYVMNAVTRVFTSLEISNLSELWTNDLAVVGIGLPLKYHGMGLNKSGTVANDQKELEELTGSTIGGYQIRIRKESQEKKYTIEI